MEAELEMYHANIDNEQMRLNRMKQRNQACIEPQKSIVQHLKARLNDAMENLRQFVCHCVGFL